MAKTTDSKNAQDSKKAAPKKKGAELSEKDLDGVSGGMIANPGFEEGGDSPRLP